MTSQTRASMGGFVVTLVAGILALVFLPMGVAYLVIGLAGGPDAFTVLGPVFIGLGLLLAAAWHLLRRRVRAAAERERALLRARTRATVVDVQLHPYVRIGSLVTVTLTVRFGEGTFSRRLHVSPLIRLERGQEIEVAYDPDHPANFQPITA